MATETPIEKKIRQFKAEVGDRELTTEQAKIYAAFTKTKGKAIKFTVTDKSGESFHFMIDPTKRGEGSQHVLMKHYKGIGRVTAFEILNLCDVIRKGEKSYRDQCVNYKWKHSVNGVTFTTSVKISKSDHFFKSFYSNRKK